MRLRYYGCLLWCVSVLMCMHARVAYAKISTLELHQVSLAVAVQTLARMAQYNVVISPSVKGDVRLSLHAQDPQRAFDVLLRSYGLAQWRLHDTYFIAPEAEVLQRQQAHQQLLKAQEALLPLTTRIWPLHYAKAQEIAQLLLRGKHTLLSPEAQLQVDVRSNALCVQDHAPRLVQIARFIRALDIPVAQIVIEARLVSIDQDQERALGLHFFTEARTLDEHAHHAVVDHAAAILGQYSLAIAKLADKSLLDIKLSALETAGHAELISSPRLFTTNQQTAAIEAGEEVPYQEVSEGGGTGVQFKKAVLGLKVTPQVLPGQRILLALSINQDRPTRHLVQGMPSISTRHITTTVLAHSGETLVLGGIYEANQENSEERIPFISQVPLLGLLFKQHHRLLNKRELLIFVTPKIIA